MKCLRSLAGLIALSSGLYSCATIGANYPATGGGSSAGGHTLNAQPVKGGSPQDPLLALDRELSSVRTDRVVVPTELLRTLVLNEKLLRNQCADLSGQLQALKNVDLQEAKEKKAEEPGQAPGPEEGRTP